MPRKPALVCLVHTCRYKEPPRQPSPTFKFQVLSCAPSMKAAFQSNLRVFCNFCFMYLGFRLLTCEHIIFFFAGFYLMPLSLDNFRYVLAGISKLQPVASSCVLLFGGLPVARTDKENLPFCPGGRRSTFLLSPGQLIAADGLTDSPPEVSAHFKPLLLCQFLVRICDKSLNIL